MSVYKKDLNDHLQYIDFLLGGNKELYDSIDDDSLEPFTVRYEWKAAHPDYTDIEDWEEAIAYQDMIIDFSHSIMNFLGPKNDYEKFVELGSILRDKYKQKIPAFADIFYGEKYIGALLLTKESFDLINSQENTWS